MNNTKYKIPNNCESCVTQTLNVPVHYCSYLSDRFIDLRSSDDKRTSDTVFVATQL